MLITKDAFQYRLSFPLDMEPSSTEMQGQVPQSNLTQHEGAAMTWVCAFSEGGVMLVPHKYCLAPLAAGKGLDTRQLGQTGLGGASLPACRQTICTGKAHFPARQWPLSTGKQPLKCHFIFPDQFLKGKAQEWNSRLSRAVRGVSNSQMERPLKEF